MAGLIERSSIRAWYLDWRHRIRQVETDPLADRVRSIDVVIDWMSIASPALEPHHVMPAWWLALTDDEKRAEGRHPDPVIEYRPAPTASEMGTGFSIDVAGRYLKTRDGTIYRDRRTAARALKTSMATNEALAEVVGWLPSRASDGRLVRGREPERVLEALVCRNLVEIGMSQREAVRAVNLWSDQLQRDDGKTATENRRIWQEYGIPRVAK